MKDVANKTYTTGNLATFSKPHLQYVYQFWKELVQPSDLVIDATCGNGHDTLKLTELTDNIVAIDIQFEAIRKAKLNVPSKTVMWHHQTHESFPQFIMPDSVTLIAYNLGYLPGGDKRVTTRSDSTIMSIESALPLLKPGGAITLTCYTGHPEGELEEKSILKKVKQLDKQFYLVSHTQWINRNNHPSVIKIIKLG